MNINKLIFKYVFEILVLIMILFITYPVWQILGESKGASIAESYEDFNSSYLSMYFDKVQALENLYPTEDEKIDKNNYTNVSIVNNTKEDMGYKLVIAVQKNSTIDVNYVKISVDNSVKFLNDLYMSSDEYMDYYELDSDIVKSNDVNNIKVYLWISMDAPNQMQDKSMEFNYKLIEKSI